MLFFLSFLITDAPSGHPKMQVKGQNESLYGNETLTVACRWRGGNPEANLRLTCGSMTYMGVSEAAVLLEFAKHLNVTSCTCEGIHPLKHIVHTRNVSFNCEYKPLIHLLNFDFFYFGFIILVIALQSR